MNKDESNQAGDQESASSSKEDRVDQEGAESENSQADDQANELEMDENEGEDGEQNKEININTIDYLG